MGEAGGDGDVPPPACAVRPDAPFVLPDGGGSYVYLADHGGGAGARHVPFEAHKRLANGPIAEGMGHEPDSPVVVHLGGVTCAVIIK